MRRRLLLALAIALLAAGAGYGAHAATSASSAIRTVTVKWSPFASATRLKSSLHVKTIRGGQCEDGSEGVGSIAYRCFSGNGVYDPCWRDSPDRTGYVVCAGDPWATVAVRFAASEAFPLDDERLGVLWGSASSVPWGLEVSTGDRCTLAQGAHDRVGGEGSLVVDYFCTGSLALLRNLRRGRTWRIGSARNKGGHYTVLGDVTVRRAYFGALPPELSRQQKLATEAAHVAPQIIRAHHGIQPAAGDLDYPMRVRLSLPDAGWARVEFPKWEAPVRGKSQAAWDVILRLMGGDWIEATPFQPYCAKLPAAVRRQLLSPHECRRERYR